MQPERKKPLTVNKQTRKQENIKPIQKGNTFKPKPVANPPATHDESHFFETRKGLRSPLAKDIGWHDT